MGLERQRQVGRAYRWKCIVRACMFLYTHICATGLPFLSQSSWCMTCSVWNIASLQFYHCTLTRKWKPLWICQLSLWSRWWCWSGILVSEWEQCAVHCWWHYRHASSDNPPLAECTRGHGHTRCACLSWVLKLLQIGLIYLYILRTSSLEFTNAVIQHCLTYVQYDLVHWYCPKVPVLTYIM